MNRNKSQRAILILLAIALSLLLLTNLAQPVRWGEMWALILLFSVLLALANDLALWGIAYAAQRQSLHRRVSRYRVPLTDHESMIHIGTLAASLAIGLVPALWSILLGIALAETCKQLLALRLEAIPDPHRKRWLSAATIAGRNAISLCIAGLVYQGIGESLAAPHWTWRNLLAIIPLCGSYFLVNKILGAWLLRVRGEPISNHFQRCLRSILTWQLLPLPFAVILARAYFQLDTLLFVIFCILFVALWTQTCILGVTRRDAERHSREVHTLSKVGQAIATSLESDVLLNIVYHQIRQLIEADNFYIVLYDTVTDGLTFPLVLEDGERKRYSRRRTSNALSEYVIRQRKPLLIRENTMQVVAGLGLEMIGQPALSWLGVPMTSGDKVLGMITVQSFARHHAYDETDVAILSTLATQVAVALENAQLYGQMRRRTAELALLNTISSAISSTLDFDRVLHIIVTSIMPVMVCQKSALYLLDGPDGQLQLSASQGFSAEFKHSLLWQDDALVHRMRDQSMIVVPDVNTSDCSAAEIELVLQEGCRAFAKVALVTQNELIGALCIYYDQVHHFDLAERDLLTTFANQSATAITNAHLFSHTDQALARRVEELSAIERIGRELTSMLEPQRVLDLVLEQAINATNATQGCIAMLSESQGLLDIVAQHGYTTETAQVLTNKPRQLNVGIVGRVLRSGQLALVRDVRQDPAYVSLDPAVRSQLTVPVVREGITLGAINLENNQVNGLDKQDANFVSQLAIQTAVALQNAQLFQERSQRVEELSLLYQASLSLASSLEYQDVLDIISRLARHVTNSDTVTLYLYDKASDQLERVSTQGYEADRTHSSTIRRKGTARTVIETGRPLLISDTLTHPEINPLIVERGIRSIIGVPVMSRGEVLGVLFVNSRQPDVYTDNDVRLVSALANQGGVTIANVRLFAQISEARDHLEAIINSSQEGILVLDNAERVVIANAKVESFSELRQQQLVGSTIEELMQHHPDELMNLLGLSLEKLHEWMALLRADPTESFGRTFQTPAPSRTTIPQQSSRPRFTEIFSTPVLDEMELVIGRLIVFRDITEEKELEQTRNDLTGMMVHDLRSPLTAVLSGLEMLKELALDKNSDPLAVQAMQVAKRSCQNMLMLVDSLLDISRLESGRMPLERAPAPFAPLARSAVSYLSPLAVERNVTIHTELPDDLPMVEMDNEKIRRVLINLLDNALKFTPEGEQIILCASHQNRETENVILCSVSDAGPGISKEFQDKIFERFTQVRTPVNTKRQRGTGLGLAFCKLAIQAHDGRIWVESESGKGSTFFFTLPVADIDAWLNE